MDTKKIRAHILELCSEDAHGSWEFWAQDKTAEELNAIASAIAELMGEKKLEALEHKVNGPYTNVLFDITRLRNELEHSRMLNIDPDAFYWFSATEEGKKEDQILRGQP